MTTSGKFLAGLAGIALLFAASLLALRATDPGAPALPAAATREAATDLAATTPAPSPAPGPAQLRPAAEPAFAPAEAAASPLPSDIRERQRALEPLRREVFAGLAELDGRVEACQLRDGALHLTLETLEGRVRVLQVRVTATGAGQLATEDQAPPPRDDAAARCVRGALELAVVSAPSARPGRRWEMSYWPGAGP